jgi:hypothetical protein
MTLDPQKVLALCPRKTFPFPTVRTSEFSLARETSPTPPGPGTEQVRERASSSRIRNGSRPTNREELSSSKTITAAMRRA